MVSFGLLKRAVCMCANREIVIALVLTVTNTIAFSRCDKFSQASSFAGSALSGSGLARRFAGGMVGRLWK